MKGLPNRGKKREASNVENVENDFSSKRRFLEKSRPNANLVSSDPMDVDVEGDTASHETVISVADPAGRQHICYGTLFSAKAQATSAPRHSMPPWTSFVSFPITERDGSFFLCQSFESISAEFALLDVITTRHLNAVRNHGDLTFTAVVSSAILAKIPRQSSRKKTIIDITINILGPEHLAKTAGDVLADRDSCLQHPNYLEPDIEYKNPHYFYPEGTMADLRRFVGPSTKITNSVQASQKIDQILEALGDVPAAGFHVEDTDIAETASRFLNGTKLMVLVFNYMFSGGHLQPVAFLADYLSFASHQLVGVRYILGREDMVCSHAMDRDMWELIDPLFASQPSAPGLGGILGDVMGLGKTLTMLSAIACAKQRMLEGTVVDPPESPDILKTEATLVVLPSRQLLDVWDAEIKRHFRPESLSVVLFHNDNRCKDPRGLIACDVVLTTYHTLAADWKGSKVLQNVVWSRVVLDEAHWIRNQATGLFKAAAGLRATRRWCLTGTPIQNTLHDLRSLLKFLRHGPLSESKYFEKYICQPIKADPTLDQSFRNLQILLRTVCLRRTEALLSLPSSTTVTIQNTLSPEESAAYKRIETQCQEEFERQLCSKSKANSSTILFQTIMKLRRLCNHGTFVTETVTQRSPSPSRKRGGSKGLATMQEPRDPSCNLCNPDEEDIAASLEGVDECPLCGRRVTDTAASQSTSTRRWLTVDGATNGCSIASEGNGTLSPTRSTASLAFPPTGYSSKLTAVIDNICESCTLPGNKSIVFSSWRTTLDILGMLLTERRISWLKIDGGVTSTTRSAILSQFNEDESFPVLLLTIDSGAVGLTITSANRVHLVEPIYNPATEAQAIGRVLRIGQTRPVTIIKYVTEKTVEPNIIALQDRKRRLAKLSLDDQVTEGDSLDDLKFVLDTSRS